eukprot:1361195-Pleurochrysis_carterae.AAC.1
MSPTMWGATYSPQLPTVSKVARIVLAQPVAASSAGRNWSIYSLIKTKVRSRLGYETADKL